MRAGRWLQQPGWHAKESVDGSSGYAQVGQRRAGYRKRRPASVRCVTRRRPGQAGLSGPAEDRMSARPRRRHTGPAQGSSARINRQGCAADRGLRGAKRRMQNAALAAAIASIWLRRGPPETAGARGAVVRAEDPQGGRECPQDRCRSASYRHTPLATDTFRLSTAPFIGMLTSSSQVLRVSWRIPSPSAPSTRATGPFRSTW